MIDTTASSFGELHIVSNSDGELKRLIDLLEESGIELESSCAGTGTCGKCRVQIIKGECSPAGSEELELLLPGDIAKGIRLACHCMVSGEVALRIEETSNDLRILENGLLPNLEFQPAIHKRLLPAAKQNQGNSVGDQIWGQCISSTECLSSLNFPVLIEENTHSSNLTAIFRANKLIGLEAGDSTEQCYGVALDIGTTTVVAALRNLHSGVELAVASELNPQTSCGLDVLSRIQYTCKRPHGLSRLNSLIIECINRLIAQLCEQSGISKLHIYEIAAAGNTVMLHLLLGVSPASIGQAPYNPVFMQAQLVNANSTGISVSPFAQLYCLPSVSGFIGADTIAGIVATDLDSQKGNVLFIDLGTNGEIVLRKGEKLISCSTAAGPALEGMNIACGMRAASGAVEEVWLQNYSMYWRTIAGDLPQGLCGSGLLDLVVAMLDGGLLKTNGRIIQKSQYEVLHPQSALLLQLDETAGKRRFWLLPSTDAEQKGVYISQADIRQVQLAKSAIASGVKTLLAQAHLTESDIDRVYLAGAFGACLQPRSLVRLGFLPANCEDRITFMGNTAQVGAVMALLSNSIRHRMEELRQKVDYIRLESCPDFEKLFVQNMGFPSKA